MLLRVSPRHALLRGGVILLMMIWLATVIGLSMRLRTTMMHSLNTIVAVAQARRDLDDLRFAATRETAALFRYGRSHHVADLEEFREDGFAGAAWQSHRTFLLAGVPLANVSLENAVMTYENWSLRMLEQLQHNPDYVSPPTAGRHSRFSMSDVDVTMNAINSDVATIRTLLDERMTWQLAEIAKSLPLVGLLAGVIIIGVSSASITALLMARRLRREQIFSQQLTTAFDVSSLPSSRAVNLDGILAHAAVDERVGGDWYDVQVLPDGQFFMTIGDVGGHGIQAAITTARLRRELLGAAIGESDPAAVLQRANREHVGYAGDFTATLCAYYNPQTGEFRYASAGLPPPLVRCRSESHYLPYGGPLLGIFPDTRYEHHAAFLQPGDTVVLYTDGAIELSHDTLEGEIRLAEATRQIHGANVARELYENVFNGRRPQDDVAILALSVTEVQTRAVVTEASSVKQAEKIGGKLCPTADWA